MPCVCFSAEVSAINCSFIIFEVRNVIEVTCRLTLVIKPDRNQVEFSKTYNHFLMEDVSSGMLTTNSKSTSTSAVGLSFYVGCETI
jgi:hypothetical protein